MSKEEDLIIEALEFAKSQGFKLIRDATFDRTTNPISCNALGAILLKLNKQDLVSDKYDPKWLKEISNYLNQDRLWLFKFVSGFSYGNELVFTYMENDKEKKETDKISRWANKLANKYCK